MSPADPRALLARYGLRPKKSWGQNFLWDPHIHQGIVKACALSPEDWVVEIGAGLGTLTTRLAECCARVVAIERDRDLCAVLRQELGGDGRIELWEANALTLDYGALAERAGRRLVLAGNLPYQIATPLLLAMVAARGHLARAVVMLQLEMARRLVAPPGTREYGALTVALATYADLELCFRVRKGAFVPAPAVDSAVVRLLPLHAPRARIADPAAYERLVRAAFAMRRKTLRNALRGVAAEADFARAGIDPARRGETLSVEEFARLAEAAHA